MANPPGGPISGGMEAQQALAREMIQERQQQQGAERQESAQQTERPQQAPAPSRDELQAAAMQRNQEENERVAERNAQERAAKQQALIEAAQAIPPENPNRDQQLEQQRQRGGREI